MSLTYGIPADLGRYFSDTHSISRRRIRVVMSVVAHQIVGPLIFMIREVVAVGAGCVVGVMSAGSD